MLPPLAATRPVTRLERRRVDLGRQHGHQVALGVLAARSASTSGLDRHLYAASVPTAAPRSTRTPSTSSARHGHLDAEQQAPVHPDLLDVLHRDAAPARPAKSRSEIPGPSWPLTVTRMGQPGSRLTTAVPSAGPGPSSRHGRARSFSSTHPWPSTQRRTIRAGTPATTQRSGISPRTTAPAATTTCSPICAPGQHHHVGPQPAPRADPHRRLGRPLPADRLHRILVAVVLVGDVDVGTGLDVVTDLDLPMPDDVRAPPDEAAAADGHHRVGRHHLAGRHPGREAGVGPDHRLVPDLDVVLVVDGPLGEEDAGAADPSARTDDPRGSSGPMAPSSPAASQAPCTTRESGRRSGPGIERAQVTPECVGGAGGPSERGGAGARETSQVHWNGAAPSHRTAATHPPVTRLLDGSAGSIAGSSSILRRSARPGWPSPPRTKPTPRRHVARSRACPAPPPQAASAAGRRQRQAAQRRRDPDRALAHRRERQAGTLDWVCSTSSPTTRSRATPARSARSAATTSPCSSTRLAQAVQVQAYRMGYYQGFGGRLVWQSDMVRPARSRHRS